MERFAVWETFSNVGGWLLSFVSSHFSYSLDRFLTACFSFSLSKNVVFILSLVATDVFRYEQRYTPAHHSLSHRATMLTDDVLVYGTLNQLSKALSGLSLIFSLSQNVSPPVGC